MGIDPSAGRPPVVVAGAYQTGVNLMRDLGRRKVEVCCIDCSPGQQGFRTVYGKGYLCPNPDTEPAEWERFMIELAGRIGRKPALIPSADQFVTAIAAHAAALEPHYIFRPASVTTQALLGNQDAAVRHRGRQRPAGSQDKVRAIPRGGAPVRPGGALPVPHEAGTLPGMGAVPAGPPAAEPEDRLSAFPGRVGSPVPAWLKASRRRW